VLERPGPRHRTASSDGTADRQRGVATAGGATGPGARRNQRRSSSFSELRVIALVITGESTMVTSLTVGYAGTGSHGLRVPEPGPARHYRPNHISHDDEKPNVVGPLPRQPPSTIK